MLQEFKTTELEYKIRTRAVENALRSREKHDVQRIGCTENLPKVQAIYHRQ